jgi:hypothetical protein
MLSARSVTHPRQAMVVAGFQARQLKDQPPSSA